MKCSARSLRKTSKKTMSWSPLENFENYSCHQNPAARDQPISPHSIFLKWPVSKKRNPPIRVIDIIKCQSFIHLPRLAIKRHYYCQPMMPMQPMHHYQAFESMNLVQYFPTLCACNNRSQGPWCPPSAFFFSPAEPKSKKHHGLWVFSMLTYLTKSRLLKH